MIKAVFFDLYNTLARFYPPKEQVQTQACLAFGFKVTHQGLARGYALADGFMERVNASSVPLQQLAQEDRARFFAEYERLVLKGAGVEVDVETAGRVWTKVREIPYGLALYDDVLPTLKTLKARGLVLGLLSNMDRDAVELCEELGLASYLDFAVTSREAGSAKPNPPMFLMALERAGMEPSQALHVGDSYMSDVQGARGVGINPVLLDREGVHSRVTDCPRIRSLIEVQEHL